MELQEKAIRFVELFCAGDAEGLEALLAPALKFSGPLFQFSNRKEYMDSLRADPPQPVPYHLLSVTAGDKQVAIFYDYVKGDSTLTVAQLFRFDSRKQIESMQLVFDSKALD